MKLSQFFTGCIYLLFLLTLSNSTTTSKQNKLTQSLHRKAYDVDITGFLHAIRDEIISSQDEAVLPIFHGGFLHETNYKLTVDNKWTNFTFDFPIMIVGTALETGQFGNNIGSFLTDIACASMSGAHIVIIDIFRSSERRTDNRIKNNVYSKLFFNSIPPVIVHPNPAANREMALKKYTEVCWPAVFPWVSDDFISSDLLYIYFCYISHTHTLSLFIHIHTYSGYWLSKSFCGPRESYAHSFPFHYGARSQTYVRFHRCRYYN